MTATTTLRTVDLVYRTVAYRIHDDIREYATIRPMEQPGTACDHCGRVIPVAARYLLLPLHKASLHVRCAIESGGLVRMATR